MAQLCAVMANTVPRKKGAKAFKAGDFMFDFDKPPPEPQTEDEMKAVVKRLLKNW